MPVDSLRYVHDSRAAAPHTYNNFQQNSKLLCIQSAHVSFRSLRIKVNTRSCYHRSSPYANAFRQITYPKYISKLRYTEAYKSVVWFNCTTRMLISQASSSNIPNLIVNKLEKKQMVWLKANSANTQFKWAFDGLPIAVYSPQTFLTSANICQDNQGNWNI